MTSIAPYPQLDASPARTAPGTSALALVLTPQVLPIVASEGEDRQSIGIGKPLSTVVAAVSRPLPLATSVIRSPLPAAAPGSRAVRVRSLPAMQSLELVPLCAQYGECKMVPSLQ